MIKYYCDRCGAEVPEKDVKDDYEERASNVSIYLYTGEDDDPFVQGLTGKKSKCGMILCMNCMKSLMRWLVGGKDEQP